MTQNGSNTHLHIAPVILERLDKYGQDFGMTRTSVIRTAIAEFLQSKEY